MNAIAAETETHRRDAIALALSSSAQHPALLTASGASAALPEGFPAGIAVMPMTFQNWSLEILDLLVWTARPRSVDDVVAIANWAAKNGWRIRALGSSHNWSPIVIPAGTPPFAKTMLLDTGALTGPPVFTPGDPPTVTVGAGMTLEALTAYLQSLDNGGASTAPGYAFLNMPAPGILTVGGMMAIGAHGTGVPFDDGDEPQLNGSISNLITAFTAVVTDPGGDDPTAYVAKRFDRADPAGAAFLVHLGRAFVTDVTLAVVPNYYLQVTNWYPPAATLFEPPSETPSPESLAAYLDRYGRLEVIWFPFTDRPWLKTWERVDEAIQPQVAGPYNYPWANNISLIESSLISAGLRAVPSFATSFGPLDLAAAQVNAPAGAQLNGTARDLLLYVENTTLRVTACGYAIQIRRSEVQAVANAFYRMFTTKLAEYAANGAYPVNGPVEIRYTTVDHTEDLGIAGALPPALCAANPVDPADPTLDTVFWIDILSVPNMPDSGAFFAEVEEWYRATYGAGAIATQRPEWSKGWAYTTGGGPWSDETAIETTIPGYYNQPPATSNSYATARKVLAAHDRSGLYTNPFLDRLMPGA